MSSSYKFKDSEEFRAAGERLLRMIEDGTSDAELLREWKKFMRAGEEFLKTLRGGLN